MPRRPASSHLPTGRLNDDILRHIVSYLSPETLTRVNAANFVFFDAWMKSRYESLTLMRSDKRLLVHLKDPNVARYVKRVVMRPWLVRPPELRHSIREIFNPDHSERKREQKLQKSLREDIELVVGAFNAMQNINEYGVEWDEESHYRPELYKAFLAPTLQKWTGHLIKLTIKVPPEFLKFLASVRLRKLETLEYHFCTGVMSLMEIDDVHNGFLVFVNNLKDSLGCISFISTHASRNLDITRIYRSLGSFPKLRSISLSVPFEGAHLSDPLAFVEFLEKHRYTLKNINLLTSRCTPGRMASNPEWIQTILISIHRPFPQLRSLALAMRPLRASLTNASHFLEIHLSTLDSLILADRALDYSEFARLMKTTSGGSLDLTGLRHLRIKLNVFCPNILYYLASKIPGLTSLDIECSSIRGNDPATSTYLAKFSREIIANKHRLVNWKLQRMAIGPQAQDWARYIERALVECMPSLMIAIS